MLPVALVDATAFADKKVFAVRMFWATVRHCLFFHDPDAAIPYRSILHTTLSIVLSQDS